MAYSRNSIRDRLRLFWASARSPYYVEGDSMRALYVPDPISTFVLALISGAPLLAVVFVSSAFKNITGGWIAAALPGIYFAARLLEVLCFPVKIAATLPDGTATGWRARILALAFALSVFVLLALAVLIFLR
jgi:hypothetical protein